MQFHVSDIICGGQAKFDKGMGSRDSSAGTVTRLRAEQRRDRGSIPCRGKRVVSNPQRPDGFWSPVSTGSALPGMKRPRREADN